MSDIQFEWDPAKAVRNLMKHGVSFDEACTVFEDDDALLMPDPDHSVGEERFVILAFSEALRLLIVVHCERDGGRVIRLISARRADAGERALYASRKRP
jgi:hypothetical protein